MNRPAWTEHLLPTPDGELAWYETGSGAPLVFLHGGPGDDHRYMKALAEPLADHFRCILYDQRGSG
jgi:proline iminopeptidase